MRRCKPAPKQRPWLWFAPGLTDESIAFICSETSVPKYQCRNKPVVLRDGTHQHPHTPRNNASQRARRTRSSSSRIRHTAPSVMALSARLKAGKYPPWKTGLSIENLNCKKSTT